MKNFRFLKVAGSVAMCMMLFFNFSHAINDYGIRTNSLSSVVLGQKSTSSSSNDSKKCRQGYDSYKSTSPTCPMGARFHDCNYTVYIYKCEKGEGYSCYKGTQMSGHDCNVEYNSSNDKLEFITCN